MTGPLWIALVYNNKHLRLVSRRGVHWQPRSEIRACSEVKSLMVFVKSYDSEHFSIPQATVRTCYLQKAAYLLHKQLLYWSPTFSVINLRDKLSISKSTARLLLQQILTHTHNLLQKSCHTFLNQQLSTCFFLLMHTFHTQRYLMDPMTLRKWLWLTVATDQTLPGNL